LKLKISAHNYLRFCAFQALRRPVFLLLFLSAIILPTIIYGKTPAQYRENVKAARVLTGSLIYTDVEEMSAAEYKNYERQSLAEIRSRVPAGEKIDWQAAVVETDNRWLVDKLSEFEKEPEDSPKREAILTEIGERLEAIEQKLIELESSPAADRTKDEDKQKLAEILRREEYVKPEKPEESFFEKTWRRFKEWLREMFPQPDVPAPTESSVFQSLSLVLQMILYALVLGAGIFLIYRFAPFFAQKLKYRQKKQKSERVILGEKLADDATARNLFDEAEILAGNGNLRGAIRKGYIALLCELNDRKIIGLAGYKTNRDYLRDVRKEPKLYEDMNGLTANFERHWYGFESVEEKDWNEFKDRYKKVVSLES